ncbi:MAG TPA: anti-virulence regulator CigR family protein [Pseudomonas sp.]|nr:anti-virulence regulator CigR family protein [Pseudomonas sp.]
MDKTRIASLAIALLCASPLLSALPQGPDEQQGRAAQHGGKAAHSQPHNPGNVQSTPQKSSAKTHAQQPPRDFAPVHQAFREHRGQIGRGGPLPAGIKIQKGKPLPHGYGKRLDARALKGLPHYPGYEWRRVGSDIVLITVTSGIVYTILQGVLD